MKGLKTTDIKGKQYVEVNERIRYFREAEQYKGWSLTSEIISLENGVVTMLSRVIDENGNVRATGHAQEKEGSTYINKTSYIENCETSAWGRALGNLGIGIDTSVASADEVVNAINNQNPDFRENEQEPMSELTKGKLRGMIKSYKAVYNTTSAKAVEVIEKRFGKEIDKLTDNEGRLACAFLGKALNEVEK